MGQRSHNDKLLNNGIVALNKAMKPARATKVWHVIFRLHRHDRQSVTGGIFMSRVGANTSASSLRQYIKDCCGVNTKCFDIKTKYDTYSSFRVLAEITNTLSLLFAVFYAILCRIITAM